MARLVQKSRVIDDMSVVSRAADISCHDEGVEAASADDAADEGMILKIFKLELITKDEHSSNYELLGEMESVSVRDEQPPQA